MEGSKRNRKYCAVELSAKTDADDSGRYLFCYGKEVGIIECVSCPSIWEWVGYVRRYEEGLRWCLTART
jgi:hypothetical protein